MRTCLTPRRAKQAADINWRYIGDAIPAFLAIAIMPFTYSIAYGLIAGIISYIILNTAVWLVELASGRRIRPADKEYKDPWTYKLEGGILPPWVTRAARGKKDFWRPYPDVEDNTAPSQHVGGTTLEGKEVAEYPPKGGFGHEGHDGLASSHDARNGERGSSSDEGEKVKA